MEIRMDANSSANEPIESTTTDNAAMDSATFEDALVKKRSGRSKASFNFWIDVLAFLTFLISTISGLVLMHPGSHGAETGPPNGDILWGLSRFEWQHLHTQISLVFVALIAVHLAMHWRWIASRLNRLVPFHSKTVPDKNR
jgi:hypothetical protein